MLSINRRKYIQNRTAVGDAADRVFDVTRYDWQIQQPSQTQVADTMALRDDPGKQHRS